MDKKEIEDLKLKGLDIVDMFENILQAELNRTTNEGLGNYFRNMIDFMDMIPEVKALNRKSKINSLLTSEEHIQINMEDTDEFKKLKPTEQEKYLKTGKIL